MKLTKFNYSEFNDEREWKIENFTLGNINLIVGDNATGKTRTLNVIGGLSRLVSEVETLQWSDGNYDVEFEHESKIYKYRLEYHQGKVQSESLTIDSEVVLSRHEEGEGEIFADQLKQHIQFQTAQNRVAVFAKRDAIQHPFLEDIYQWGKGLLRYDFGTLLGKDTLVVRDAHNNDLIPEVNIKDTQRVIGIFLKGQKDFKRKFVNAIITDMGSIGYKINYIGVASPAGLKIVSKPANLLQTPLVLSVKEADIEDPISQMNISQGMFRALSILIQINYSFFSGKPSCILIDDIGEGLDFRRSSSLVKVLIDKVKKTSTQLIMTTNDRFIMNNVPLEYWIILERKKGEIINHSIRNSKEMFDKFEMTGLSNFDLFSTNYYKR